MESATRNLNTSDNRSDSSDRSVHHDLSESLHGFVFGIVSPEDVDTNCVQNFEKCFKHVLQELKQKKNCNAKAKRDKEKAIAKAKKAAEKADLKAAAKAQKEKEKADRKAKKAEERAKLKAQKEKEKAELKARKAAEKDAQRVERKRKREEENKRKREEKKMCTTEGILRQVQQLTSNEDFTKDSEVYLNFKRRFQTFLNNKKKRRKVQTMEGLGEQKLIDSNTCPHADNADLLAKVQTQQLIDVSN